MKLKGRKRADLKESVNLTVDKRGVNWMETAMEMGICFPCGQLFLEEEDEKRENGEFGRAH